MQIRLLHWLVRGTVNPSGGTRIPSDWEIFNIEEEYGEMLLHRVESLTHQFVIPDTMIVLIVHKAAAWMEGSRIHTDRGRLRGGVFWS